MTTCIRILTTSTLDSSPSVLLITPNGSKTLINCGEGCQRSFLESSSINYTNNDHHDQNSNIGGLRLRSVNRILLTHIGHDSVGGLPGLILTSADAAESNVVKAASNVLSGRSNVISTSRRVGSQGINDGVGENDSAPLPGLDVLGPEGTKLFLHSLRHFMRRDRFQLRVTEGATTVDDNSSSSASGSKKKGKKKQRKRSNGDDGNIAHNLGFCITAIPFVKKVSIAPWRQEGRGRQQQHHKQDVNGSRGGIPEAKRPRLPSPIQKQEEHSSNSNSNDTAPSLFSRQGTEQQKECKVASYLIQTPPIPGKFLLDKAKALGVPPGPLYGKLKGGNSVTFDHPVTNASTTVHPNDVLAEGSDGVVIAYVYCPDVHILDQLVSSSAWDLFKASFMNDNYSINAGGETQNASPSQSSILKAMEVMMHNTPKSLFLSKKYQEWIRQFGTDVQHITLHPMDNDFEGGGNEELDGTPFRSAALGAMTRSLICEDLYPSPFPFDDSGAGASSPKLSHVEMENNDVNNVKKKEEADTDMQNTDDENRSTNSQGITVDTDTENDGNGVCVDPGEKNHDENSTKPSSPTEFKIMQGRPLMEYVLVPLSKRGVNPSSIRSRDHLFGISKKEKEKIQLFVEDTGASGAAKDIMSSILKEDRGEGSDCCIGENCDDAAIKMSDDNAENGDKDVVATAIAPINEPLAQGQRRGELIFTGTGSALPCKHRNVTGIYIQMANGNGMLLDVGEGTTGQLLRSWKRSSCANTSLPLTRNGISCNKDINYRSSSSYNYSEEVCKRMKGIKAIWISHPHADHHLGILRFLTIRNIICDQYDQQKSLNNEATSNSTNEDDPLLLMAPPNMFRFLSEYGSIDPMIRGGYIPVDCRDMMHNCINPFGKFLYQRLGISWCASVPVAHCPHSYAVVIDGTAFGRVVYSGDCRPSDRLAEVGRGADLLIHEATFEDGMEEEALLKRHSTVGEALGVARKMRAGAIVLTHFSQRYPRIPPLNDRSLIKEGEKELPIAFAFDFMRVRPVSLKLASKLTPALRLLYPDNEHGDDKDDTNGFMEIGNDIPGSLESSSLSAKEIMSVPGVFAANFNCNP